MKIINDFIRTTQPAAYHRGRWRALLKAGKQAPLPAHVSALHAEDIA